MSEDEEDMGQDAKEEAELATLLANKLHLLSDPVNRPLKHVLQNLGSSPTQPP